MNSISELEQDIIELKDREIKIKKDFKELKDKKNQNQKKIRRFIYQTINSVHKGGNKIEKSFQKIKLI